MNILYVGAFRLPNFDAAAPRVLNNGRIFTLLGHKVKYISWGGEYRDADLCDDGRYRIDGMEYAITNELDSNGSLFDKFMQVHHRGKKALAILEKIEPKPDLLILYNAGYGWTKQMLKYCKNYNIKLANDITEWYDSNEIHFWDIYSHHKNMMHLQKEVPNKICISSYLFEFYQGSNNLLLPPLCDFSEKKWSTTIEDERIQPFEGVTLIYAGNPAKKDCVHTVINVVNKLAGEGLPIRFIVLGISRESYLQRYNKLIESGTLHKNIIFLGRVSQDLIPAYYKKADFMVLLRERTRKNMAGFPTKFAESMTAGVPVITNNTSDLKHYVMNGKTGFMVDDESFVSLEKTLLQVITLSRQQIEQMKSDTRSCNDAFHYEFRKNEVKQFLDKLK